MKNLFLCAAAALVLATVGCVSDEPDVTNKATPVVLTFEDEDVHFAPYTIDGCGKTVTLWSHLVDDPQYGGSLLYNDYSYTGYRWHDAGHTELASGIVDGGVYWNGGHAISHYYQPDYTVCDYTMQLEVSTGSAGAAGNNGSKHFAVHNGYTDEASYKSSLPALQFADGKARVIQSMYVVNTSYVLNVLIHGNDFSTPATDHSWLKITATGYDANDEVMGMSHFMLCDGKDKIVREWTRWDLTGLGKVVKVNFNLSAGDDFINEFGMTVPAYFAYDDVVVLMEK